MINCTVKFIEIKNSNKVMEISKLVKSVYYTPTYLQSFETYFGVFYFYYNIKLERNGEKSALLLSCGTLFHQST
jgi:hypothetical protein